MSASHRPLAAVGAVVRFCGSIYLGLVIMLALALAMGWATFLEREMGSPVAQYLVYASNWFYALIGALAFNLLCAVLVRIPKVATRDQDSQLRFNRALTPFFIAHIGAILLIFGCWITARQGVKARATIPEGASTSTAICVDSRQIELKLEDFATGENSSSVIPFDGGPLNWRDQESFDLWRANVARPLLDARSEDGFFKKLAKRADSLSLRAAYFAARSALVSHKKTIFDESGVKLEILEYAPLSDYAPATTLKGATTTIDAENVKKENAFTINFPFEPAALGADPLVYSRRGVRTTLDDGTRVVYMIADSNAEAEAFLEETPREDESGDLLILVLDRRRFVVPLESLETLSRYGALDEARDDLTLRRVEIERRLKQERERTDVAPDALDAETTKPLATITRDALVEQGSALRELSDKLVELSRGKDPEELECDAEFRAVADEFAQKRALNYLATTWSQLEGATPTSKEFRETLQTMLDESDKRLEEVEKLREATTLGDSGWKIVACETSPTALPNIDELYGWTCRLVLTTPQGERVETGFQSELFERNALPDSGRVFGALWLTRPSGEDSEYGRPWNKSLDKPKLELMQTRDGRLLYRCRASSSSFTRGEFPIAQIDQAKETFMTTSVETRDDANASGVRIAAFRIDEFTCQDEIGARVMPTLFQKDLANEFYGKIKVRATFDDACETFWLRAIPLESVTEAQRKAQTKTIASSKRKLTIAFSDKEIDLGATLFVRKFTPTYEPGSSTPSSFASVARVFPKETTQDDIARALIDGNDDEFVIQMNRPGTLRAPDSNKVFWAYQDSFRGPFRPGDPEFDAAVRGKLLPGETQPRDLIYHTVISFNDDPGRGLKYFASLLVVWGSALLVYRRVNRAKTTTKEEATEKSEDAIASSKRVKSAGRAVSLLLVALTFTNVAPAFADEIPMTENDVKALKESAKTRAVQSIDWTPWRSLPVFDGGRRQPLNTFAEINVREMTGSNRPIFLIPDETLAKLEGNDPLNFPDLEDFLKDFDPDESESDAASKREEREKWYREVAEKAVEQQRDVARRMRAAFPNGRARMIAAEVLFAMIAEPETWEYVPFIDDPDGTVARDVLHMAAPDVRARGGRLAPSDLDALAPGTSQTFVERYRANADRDAETIKALDAIENRLTTFRSLTFAPTRGASARAQTYLNRALFGATSHGTPGAFAMSACNKLDASCSRLETLVSREKPKLRKASPFSDKEFLLRRRTPLAGDAQGRETLLLTRQIATLAGAYRRYPLSASGRLFERLLSSVEDARKVLKAHRDEIVANETYSLEYRQEVWRATSALDEIVADLESSYLALTTEAPKELDVLPAARANVFAPTESRESPWLSLQAVLWSPDEAYVRYVDPTLRDTFVEDEETPMSRVEPFDDVDAALDSVLRESRIARDAARAYQRALAAYRDRESVNRATVVSESLADFAKELRSLAERAEPTRVALAKEVAESERAAESALAKTAYPDAGALDAEVFYYRLNAFFWNWVGCLGAVIALVLSYARQRIRRRRAKSGETVSEERFFFTVGIALLTSSCAIAFLGGALRAYITGWAPVANMFETVVLLAFLIAAIAIGRTTAPLWSRPFGKARSATAWRYRGENVAERRVSRIMFLPRLILTALVVYWGARAWASSSLVDGDLIGALRRTFESALAMQGALDTVTALATFALVAWLVPRFVVALASLAVFPRVFWRRDETDADEPGAIEQVLRRKGFLLASALVATLVAAAAYFNSSEFNPHIRPLVAVLRSNFWLTIHVIAIIVSYALGAIAWVIALASLASYIFGRYGEGDEFDPRQASQSSNVIVLMMRSAALFLTIGIILGARWADFSWGRFWSWDPKEVWALATLFVYLIVLHAYKTSGRKKFFLPLGAVFGALAIIMTWYGLSFVMGGGGRHSYAAGESNKIVALYILFAVNIAWAGLAVVRYWIERVRK